MSTISTDTNSSTAIDTSLPEGFAALEPFVRQWAVCATAERARRRLRSTAAERQAFFLASKDLVATALTELDKKSLNELNEQEQRLMNLLLSFAHVALAEEIQRDDEPKQAQLRQHLTITRASADR